MNDPRLRLPQRRSLREAGIALVAVCGGLILLAGCAVGQARARTASNAGGPPPGPDATPVPQNAESVQGPGEGVPRPDAAAWGRIRFVHPELRYVVMDFSLWRLPSIDQRLVVYREGLEVGLIRITGPALESTVAGDILNGDPKVGDEVRGEVER